MAIPFDLFLRSRRLYPFEARIVEAVKSQLPDHAAVRLQQQVDIINKVQRLARGKEVNLYHMEGGKPAFDDSLPFAEDAGEALLATATLRHPQNDSLTIRSEVWLAKGRVFSLLFDKSPQDFFSPAPLKSVEPTIVNVAVLLDPTRRRPVRTPLTRPPSRGWLQRRYAAGEITDLTTPLPTVDRVPALHRIRSAFPADYVEFLEQSEGATVAGTIVIYGVESLRKVVTPAANYYILAEAPNGPPALAVREGSSDAALYLLDPETDDPEQVGSSFDAALSRLLSLSRRS